MNAPRRSAWDATLSVMDSLRAAGHVALLAGGCVRDRLLGRVPNDYDVATNARPERVRELFPKARWVGAKFGVVLVHRFGHDIEVATFRSDGTYSDGRRPDEVTFGDDREDALRRDFTVNGLFYDPFADQVIDYVAGQADLQARVIRTIGDPGIRFAEDHLRMLRAVRLSARLGFPIEPQTAAAITRLSANLRAISPERIWMELEQVLTEPTRSEGWRLLNALELRANLSSEWPMELKADSLAEKRLNALALETVDAGLALAAALPDAPIPRMEAICRSFRLSNHLTEQVLWLKGNLEAVHRAARLELADLKPLRASPYWPLLLELLRTDLIAKGGDIRTYRQAKSRGDSISQQDAAPPPLVTGDDLLALGFHANPALGEILRAVYRAQLNETIRSHEQGIALAHEIAQQQNA
jgi:poly(A) polymerase